MHLAGIGLQRISLGALIIALSLLVDNAMITVETMVSRLEAEDTRREAATFAFRPTAFPMLTGTLVMIAGFIPVGFAASAAGEYCYTLFAVVMIALLCSWIVAVLFSPLTGSWLLPARLVKQEARTGRLGVFYRKLLTLALCHRIKTVAITLAALIVASIGTTDDNAKAGMAADDAITAAALHRSRPILLTACAAMMGMMPIAHQVFWSPMAYAIIGGLLVATLITLTVLPAAMSLLLKAESACAKMQI